MAKCINNKTKRRGKEEFVTRSFQVEDFYRYPLRACQYLPTHVEHRLDILCT